MPDSPLAASAYEILGVASTAGEEELRRAYRLRLRQAHPDTGGEAAVFVQVQRAWELVGTPGDRAAYDRGAGEAEGGHRWRPPDTQTDTRLRATSYGEAGRHRRESYLVRVRSWAGEDRTVPDPYDPAFVRTVPRELRRLLADALAEEATARATAGLGMGFTVWHGVAAGSGTGTPPDDGDRLDHVVLGPSGLYGVMSADFGVVVGFRQGEIAGPGVGARAPVAGLLARMRTVARTTRVRFTGALVVLPDDDLAQPLTPLGTAQRIPVLVVRRSVLGAALRSGAPGARPLGGPELFDVRTRLRQAVRLV